MSALVMKHRAPYEAKRREKLATYLRDGKGIHPPQLNRPRLIGVGNNFGIT